MNSEKKHVLFGQADVPALDKQQTTASYRAAASREVRQSWNIRMYQTDPASGKPVDSSTTGLTFCLGRSSREDDPTGLMRNILQERAELWHRMANR